MLPGTVVLNDFEDYKTGVEPLILLNYFGTADLNFDAQYVKRGKGSLKIVPSGCSSEEGDYSPALKQPMNVLVSGNDNSDISQLNMISTDIYNAFLRKCAYGDESAVFSRVSCRRKGI